MDAITKVVSWEGGKRASPTKAFKRLGSGRGDVSYAGCRARAARHPYRAAALVGGSWDENDMKK